MRKMKTVTNNFVVQVTEEGVKPGRSFVETPAVNFKGGMIKWFDDTKLLKKQEDAEDEADHTI